MDRRYQNVADKLRWQPARRSRVRAAHYDNRTVRQREGQYVPAQRRRSENAYFVNGAFFRAILCNWLVCLAFFIPMGMKHDGAKMFSMMLFVFCFFISGYEHSIANMCTFAIALVVDHPDTITYGGVIHNLVPVTLGNLIGGGVLMAYMYYFVNKPYFDKEDHTQE